MSKKIKIVLFSSIGVALVLFVIAFLMITNKTYEVTFDTTGGSYTSNQEVKKGESSEVIRNRVIKARKIQQERFIQLGCPNLRTNSQLKGDILEEVTQLTADAKELLINFADKMKMSARAYHRTLKLARTIADLQNEKNVSKVHIAEALSYRYVMPAKQV